MALRYCLLGLINYGEMTGYELNKAFKDSLYPVCNATTSQIYRELASMEEKGWLISREVMQTGKPNRKVYQITETGKAELKSWLKENHFAEEMKLKHAFYIQMFFAGENSIEDNIHILKEMKQAVGEEIQKAELREGEVKHYTQCVQDEDKSFYWGLVSEFTEAYYGQLIAWADRSIKKLEDRRNDKLKEGK